MIKFSVFRIHLVHFSVQVTTWLWSESSRGLIGAEQICISFVDIVALVGHIRLIHLLFIQHLSSLLILLYRSSDQIKFWRGFSIGKHRLLALSPVVSTLKVECLVSVLIKTILFIFGHLVRCIITPDVLQKSQEAEFIKPSVQAEILQNSQELEVLNQRYSQKHRKILRRWNF